MVAVSGWVPCFKSQWVGEVAWSYTSILAQWFEHELSFEHEFVRDLKSLIVYDLIIVEQNVKVNGTWTILNSTNSAEYDLHRLQQIK